jgi:ferritin-like metal-binding protein YciE
MGTSTNCTDTEFFRYLDFAENQHLKALANLGQNTEDMELYTRLLAHKEEIGELIKRRRQLLQNLDSTPVTAYEMDWQARTSPWIEQEKHPV